MGNCPPFSAFIGDPFVGIHFHSMEGYKIYATSPERAININVESFANQDIDNGLVSIGGVEFNHYTYEKPGKWEWHTNMPHIIIGWPEIGKWANPDGDIDLGLNMLYREMTGIN
jgi:hypothetical protein